MSTTTVTSGFFVLRVSFFPPQTIKNKELSSGYTTIEKPYPVKSLKMRDRFILTADVDRAEIYPEVEFELSFQVVVGQSPLASVTKHQGPLYTPSFFN